MKTISNRKRVELLFNASVAMWSLKILIESTNLDNRDVEEVPDPCDLDMLLLDIEVCFAWIIIWFQLGQVPLTDSNSG